MDSQHLDELLDQLQDEIKKTQVVDEEGKELLRHLDAEIHHLLERSSENPPTDTRNFQDAIYYFEATHPKLTALITRLLESLSNAGI
jgi:cell division septum initiation protein DivIVA